MPNVGTPPTSVRTPSHTSTEQWQSFEIKMRHRRAERCVAKAEAALEAGHDEDARAALDEARALNPESPDFDTLKARIDERHAAVAAAGRRATRLKVSSVVAATLLLAVGAFAWLGPGRGQSPDTVAASSPPKPATLPVSVPVATTTTGSESPTTGNIAATEERIVPPESPAAVTARHQEEAVPFFDAASRTASPPSSEPPLPTVREVEPEVTVPRPTTSDAAASVPVPPAMTADPLASGLPSTAAPRPVAPPLPPVAEPAKERPEIADERKVRTVLAEFEAAYSSLNAAAAQAVWPTVDARSLASAFASLRSQRVSLGTCSVQIKGAVARADCSGVTSWTPKIGGGQRRESRRWSFDLQSADGAWQIVRAQAR